MNRPRRPAWMRSLRFRLALRWSVLLALIAAVVVVVLNLAFATALGDPPDAQTYRAVEKVRTDSGFRTVRELELGVVGEVEAVTTARLLDTLQAYSGYVLGGLFLTSLLVGWWLAGRALRPLGTMTAATTRVDARDLSTRMRVEGDDELGSLARSIDAMLERLDQGFARQRQFVDDASHELRTPLAVIRANVDTVLSKVDVAEDERALAITNTRHAVDRMASLVDDLIASARASTPDEMQDELRLDELARDEAVELGVLADSREVVLEVTTAPVSVVGHGLALRRAVDNLLANAVRHSPRRGRVRIATGTVEDGWAFVAVADEGPGLSERDAEHVFDRFWRGPGQDPHDGHRGLGLSIVRQVIESHGGLARVHSRPGDGATFVLWLPRPSTRPDLLPPLANPLAVAST